MLQKKILEKNCERIGYNTEIVELGDKHLKNMVQGEIDNYLLKLQNDGDSVGGVIKCEIKNLPIGLGEPFFDSVESLIAHGIFSIPGVKGIEFGSGFKGCKMVGSKFNDVFINESGETLTNNNGGINGGITNGNTLVFNVAIKPTSSILKAQKTFNFQSLEMEELKVQGRHDAAFILRVPVIIESIVAIVLADLVLRGKR